MKQNHYKLLSELQGSLKKLFGTVGYNPDRIPLKVPHRFFQYIGTLLDNNGIYNYLNSVIGQINKATEISENIRLEVFALEEENKAQKGLIEKLENEFKEKNAENDMPDTTVNYDEKKNGKKENDKNAAQESVQNSEKEELLIRIFMSFYDRQIIKRDFAKGEKSDENDSAVRIIDSTINDITHMLEKLEVKIISTPGEQVGSEDDIVDTEETDNPHLAGRIASVVRAGYSYKGELMRAQEVIIYKERGI